MRTIFIKSRNIYLISKPHTNSTISDGNVMVQFDVYFEVSGSVMFCKVGALLHVRGDVPLHLLAPPPPPHTHFEIGLLFFHVTIIVIIIDNLVVDKNMMYSITM